MVGQPYKHVEIPKDLFSGIAQAQVRKQSNYERAGHYLERIERVKFDYNRSKIHFIAIEKTVVHVFDDAAGTGHHVGESVTHIIPAGDYFLTEYKTFVCNVMGCLPEEVTQDECMLLCSESQPLAGTIVEQNNVNRTTKANKVVTNKHYQGEVKPSVLLRTLTPKAIALFFPNGLLDQMIAAENQAGA